VVVVVSLLEDVKVALRVGHDATDSEVNDLIAAAIFDMANKGVSVTWLGTDPMDTSFSIYDVDEAELPVMAKRAIITYAKANYGYDNDDAERFMKSYDSMVCSLLNSRFNAVYEGEGVSDGALGLGNSAP
jgi:hypothetical protein